MKTRKLKPWVEKVFITTAILSIPSLMVNDCELWFMPIWALWLATFFISVWMLVNHSDVLWEKKGK